jgi:acyl-CoA reductase-like NAD-dependent aldehyde dehydrogenase
LLRPRAARAGGQPLNPVCCSDGAGRAVWQTGRLWEIFVDVYDKYSGERLGEVKEASAADVHRRTAELLDGKADGFAELIARESGKAWRYAVAEVSRAVETFEFAAEEAKRLHGETIPLDASAAGEGRLGFYLRVPVGVVAAITPFNFPLNLVAHKVAPALAAGNTVVLKPADRTPLTAVALARTLAQAGLPEGVLELVHGEGPTTGESLVRHPGPAKVSFTGSPNVGERILAIAGLKRVTLELGNNSGVMIEPDADLDKAIPRLVMSAFANAGQVCLSLQRLFVHSAIADTVLERLVEETKALKVGDPRDRTCDVGPMISEAAADRVESWIQAALDRGAKRACGGRREAKLLWPVVLTHTRPEMKVMADEVFGPVVSVVRYDTFEDGLQRLADTPYGLQAGIYTRDLEKAFTAVRRLDMGGVLINDTPIYRADHMPYGGNKRSGIGREGVRFAIEEMTNLRMVVINLA